MGGGDASESQGGREEALEHLSSWERVFWEILQDQKRRGKRVEAKRDEESSKIDGGGGPRRVLREALR
ncbi:hypothetical protein MUO93_01525 [Candidatus Bathyarchaeota archaeon]|nr:hypothetical protein [Candidatus Bathyarchaeota archaeon]